MLHIVEIDIRDVEKIKNSPSERADQNLEMGRQSSMALNIRHCDKYYKRL